MVVHPANVLRLKQQHHHHFLSCNHVSRTVFEKFGFHAVPVSDIVSWSNLPSGDADTAWSDGFPRSARKRQQHGGPRLTLQ